MKKVLIVLLVVVVIVVAVLLLAGGPKKTGLNTTSSPTPTKSYVAVIKTVDNAKLPEGLPAGLPIEAGATITQNYTTVNPAGLPLSVREFISKKTLAENATIYKASLLAASWTITNTVNDATIKIIEAKKGKINVRILIHTNDKNQVVVSIQAITNN
jgi:hypothetical protein